MPKVSVNRLRHVGVAAPNFEEAVTFYEDAWGLKRVESDTDIVFFACEGSPEPYQIRLRKAPEKRVDLIAFGVDSAADVDTLAGELAAAGVRFVSEPGALKTPGGGYGFRIFDPEGRVVEVSADVTMRQARKLEERESIPVKISHVVLDSPDPLPVIDFYDQRLGFRLSDWIGDSMCFMRCSTDHHSIGIFKGEAPALNHVAFEMRGMDEYMRGSGRVMKKGGVMRWGPGRHLVGDNTFSYFFDPNGNVSEYTTAMEQIPLVGGRAPTTIPFGPAAGDQWGTASFATPDQVPAVFKTRETGHFVAPPI